METKITPPPIPEPGNKYGEWTVISKVGIRNSVTYWLCQCSCGATQEVAQYPLINRKSHRCKKCNKRTVSQETKDLLSARRRANPPPREAGFKLTEDVKSKISDSMKNKWAAKKQLQEEGDMK